MKKILLFGADGQVGWELQRALAPLGEVIVSSPFAGDANRADFTRPESLEALVRRIDPEIIVNAAAHTAVDRCESEPELARAINAGSPAALARVAQASNATLVHYSTDYVFDGSGSTPWKEDSPTGPLSVYGRTKLEGEDAIRASDCRHLVLRTSWVYAARGGNFMRTMLKLAAERDALNVVADQIGAPTGAELLADTTALMLRSLEARPELAGTYHVVAGGECSWHDYAKLAIEFARTRGHAIRVAPEAVKPIESSAYPTPARRPTNSRLDTTRVQRAFGLRLPPWQQGVERTLIEMLDRN